VENRAESMCEGTFTNDGAANGGFSSCFARKFSGNGRYDSKSGAPNDHIIARADQQQPADRDGIGLPAQLAALPVPSSMPRALVPCHRVLAPSMALAQSAGDVGGASRTRRLAANGTTRRCACASPVGWRARNGDRTPARPPDYAMCCKAEPEPASGGAAHADKQRTDRRQPVKPQ
jgi:hypothetical protein